MKTPWKKGNWFYEMQILMLVFMWQHDMKYVPRYRTGILILFKRIYIWCDTAWFSHGVGLKFNRLWRRIKANWQVHWLLEQPVVDAVLSLLNYIRLHKAGFRITNSKDKSTGILFEIYRFWWNQKLIADMADIDCVDGSSYTTAFNGHFAMLGTIQKPVRKHISPVQIIGIVLLLTVCLVSLISFGGTWTLQTPELFGYGNVNIYTVDDNFFGVIRAWGDWMIYGNGEDCHLLQISGPKIDGVDGPISCHLEFKKETARGWIDFRGHKRPFCGSILEEKHPRKCLSY